MGRRGRMNEGGSQGTESLAEETSDSFGGPDRRAGKTVDGGGGRGVVLSEDGALHENGALGLGEAVKPVAEAAASGAGDELLDLIAGKRRRGVVFEAGGDRCSGRNVGKGGWILAMHDFESALQDAVADDAFGGLRIGAGVNFHGRDRGLNQTQGLRLAAQQERGETIHLDHCVFCLKELFARLTGTGGFRHEDTSGESS